MVIEEISITSALGLVDDIFDFNSLISKFKWGNKSTLVIKIKSASLNIIGYFKGLSSPSVILKSATLKCSPISNSAGQTKFPTFSTNKISSKSGFIFFSSNFKPPLTIFASRWHALPVVIGTTGIFNFSNLAASRLVVISPSKTAL